MLIRGLRLKGFFNKWNIDFFYGTFLWILLLSDFLHTMVYIDLAFEWLGMQVALIGKAVPAQRAPSPPPLRPLPMNAPAVVPPAAANAAANKSPAQPRRSRRGTSSGNPGEPDKPPGAARRRTRTASDEGEGLVLGRAPEGNGVGPGTALSLMPRKVFRSHSYVGLHSTGQLGQEASIKSDPNFFIIFSCT